MDGVGKEPQRRAATALDNLIADSIEPAVLRSLRSEFRTCDLTRGETLYSEGESIARVYFPATALIGVISAMPDGEAVQTTCIGREGAHEGLMEFLETQYISVNW